MDRAAEYTADWQGRTPWIRDYHDERTPDERLAARQRADAWLAIWRSLPVHVKDAWHNLPGAKKDATYLMTPSEFLAFVETL